MRILALDIGEKRIGVAVSDGLCLMAHPVETLAWDGIEKLILHLNQLIEEYNVCELVVGMPYNMKGLSSKKTEEVRAIKDALKDNLSIPVNEEDERLTTKMAERTLHDLGKKPSKNRNKIDQIAAMHILQSYIDRKNRSIHG